MPETMKNSKYFKKQIFVSGYDDGRIFNFDLWRTFAGRLVKTGNGLASDGFCQASALQEAGILHHRFGV